MLSEHSDKNPHAVSHIPNHNPRPEEHFGKLNKAKSSSVSQIFKAEKQLFACELIYLSCTLI